LVGKKIAPLTASERATLERAIVEVRSVEARTVLTRRGEVLEFCIILVKGFLSRHVDDRRGYRQIVSLQVPGDLVDFHGYPTRILDHDVAALSDAQIALIPRSAIAAITQADADLARKIWFATLLDAALHRGWIFRLGRLDAPGRVCHFLAETAARLRAVGLGSDDHFFLPITQAHLGEACSLTSIHVSRVLKMLRSSGICAFREGEVHIQDPGALLRLAQFDPLYLYLDDANRPTGGKWT
jgi:CRP-like cAMP-binding protein